MMGKGNNVQSTPPFYVICLSFLEDRACVGIESAVQWHIPCQYIHSYNLSTVILIIYVKKSTVDILKIAPIS